LPKKCVGKKIPVADYHHALGAVLDLALERDRNIERSGDVAPFVECDLVVELVHLEPAARRHFDEPRRLPLVAVAEPDLAREREYGIEPEIVGDGMAAVRGADRHRRRRR
jgi:hypothetical protein